MFLVIQILFIKVKKSDSGEQCEIFNFLKFFFTFCKIFKLKINSPGKFN